MRLRKTNQVIIEQSKDAILQQLKAKLLHEDYSENVHNNMPDIDITLEP